MLVDETIHCRLDLAPFDASGEAFQCCGSHCLLRAELVVERLRWNHPEIPGGWELPPVFLLPGWGFPRHRLPAVEHVVGDIGEAPAASVVVAGGVIVDGIVVSGIADSDLVR